MLIKLFPTKTCFIRILVTFVRSQKPIKKSITMKKTLIIAFAGMTLFAFTQCGGSSAGSKEFQDSKELIEKIETLTKEAKTCEELQEAALGLLLGGIAPQNYSEKEKMTEKEKDEIEKLSAKLKNELECKFEELGCDDD